MKTNKKKKKKRKCRDDEPEGNHCVKATSLSLSGQNPVKNNNNSITNVNNKKKVPNMNIKKCGAGEDCSLQKPNKKKPAKKNNQIQLKATPNSNNGNKNKAKKKQPNKNSMKVTTTPKVEDEIDAEIGKYEALTSDELEDLMEEDYDDMNLSPLRQSTNLIEENDLDDYNN